MLKPEQTLPAIPEIGHPESYYARQVHKADRAGHIHEREAFKVAQYITLAMDPHLAWGKKLRYFAHAIRRHCNPPPLPDEKVWLFYRQLAQLTRDYAGQEALRLASAEDDLYARRLSMGGTRERIRADAIAFFNGIMGGGEQCPEHFHDEDWMQLKLLRGQWV